MNYPTCGLRSGGCSCNDGVCYFNPSAPLGNEGCRSCHGTLDNPAPPRGVSGQGDSSDPAVGAHQAHLRGGAFSRPVSCGECHLVPERVEETGHTDTDLPAEVIFGSLATAAQRLPQAAWDPASRTCLVYCHGATLGGGNQTAPDWTRVDGTQAPCGSCHGLPPGGDHPQSDRCELCHAPTAGPSQTIANRATHVDGIVQGAVGACGSCHGTPANPAPPPGLQGETQTTDLAVGAHAAHLTDGTVRKAVACDECHPVPARIDQVGHLDGNVDVVFGALARTGSIAPTWTRSGASCAATYCHGEFKGGVQGNQAVWTTVDGSQATCSSCHGNPPPPPHPTLASCNTCHPATVTASGAIDTAGGHHIDGQVDVIQLECWSCHGAPATMTGAPPVGTHGETATTTPAVGAHAAHLDPSAWHAPVACADCHVVPTTMDHQNGTADVSFSAFAKTAGAQPVYDRGALSCAGVYCHGVTLLPANQGGVLRRTPKWTQVDGTANECGSSCHTNPPGGSHPQSGQCATCHAAVVDAAGNIKDPSLHVDGKIDAAPPPCNTCHGGPPNDAPPKALSGATATTDLAVGAHQAHLVDGPMSKAMACSECHVVPKAVNEPGHIDVALPAEVVFGPLSSIGGVVTAWTRGSATCSNSYCHGATLTGGTLTQPLWTKVDGTQAACGTCHGNPPPAPHPSQNSCNTCHPTTVTAGGALDVAGGHHVDGIIDVTGSTCTSCHGDPATGNSAPPKGTHGETATTSPAVGAHAVHLAPSATHRRGLCGDCHVVPSSMTHSNNVVDVAFSSLARTGGVTPAFDFGANNCTNVYCHGTTLAPAAAGGSVKRTPLWTQVDGTFGACGSSCHTNPPGGTHPVSTQCVACHAAVVTASGAFANAALHVNGTVEQAPPACNGCHGNAVNDAPPVSTTGATTTSDIGVGAHQRHLTDGPLRLAMPCDSCHAVPATVGQAGHIDGAPAEVIFGGLATTGGVTPGWSHTTAKCSNVYCHGASLGGGSLTTPTWTTVNGTQDACGTCHGSPPPAPHYQLPMCWKCHPATVTMVGAIDVAAGRHVNGAIESVPVHPAAVIYNTPGSGNFHGDEARVGLAACQVCHGTNLDGGGANVSCNQSTCHSGWRTNCVFCHGGADNTSGAPPIDLGKRTATTEITVGAHTSHLNARHAIASPLACGSCHLVPTDALSAGHVDAAPAEVTFGTLARTGGASPVWTRATAKCSAGYCHGQFSGGVTANAPIWNRVDNTQAACGTCHSTTPTTGEHRKHQEKGKGCDECHNTITDAGGTRIITPSPHVNGVKNVLMKVGGTYNAATRRCTPTSGAGCHDTKTW